MPKIIKTLSTDHVVTDQYRRRLVGQVCRSKRHLELFRQVRTDRKVNIKEIEKRFEATVKMYASLFGKEDPRFEVTNA